MGGIDAHESAADDVPSDRVAIKHMCASCRLVEADPGIPHPHFPALGVCRGCESQLNALEGEHKALLLHKIQGAAVAEPSSTEGLDINVCNVDDEDENFDECAICGSGGELFCCSTCPHAYCRDCPLHLFGAAALSSLETDDDWKCYACIGQLPELVKNPDRTFAVQLHVRRGRPPKKKKGRPSKSTPKKSSTANSHPSDKTSSEDPPEAADREVFTCPDCQKSFVSEPGYKYHVGQRVCLRKRARHGEIPDPTPQLTSRDGDSNSDSDVEEDIVATESTTQRPRRRAAIKAKKKNKKINSRLKLENNDTDNSDCDEYGPPNDDVMPSDEDDHMISDDDNEDEEHDNELDDDEEELVEDEGSSRKRKRGYHRPRLKLKRSLQQTIDDYRTWCSKEATGCIFEGILPDKEHCSEDAMNNLSEFSQGTFYSVNESRIIDCPTGGAVSQLEWCPSNDNLQYFALVTVPEYANGSTNDTIQIWSLDTVKEISRVEMVVEVGVGRIRDMKWCPSGVCDATSESGDSRLGLLAIAAQSLAYVFAVPNPSSLKRKSQANMGPISITGTPHLVLEDSSVPSTCVAWSTDWKHEYVAVGRENGSVGIYYLKSRGIPRTDKKSQTLVPLFSLQALNGYCIRTMNFCPEETQLLAIGGHYDLIEVWDLSVREILLTTKTIHRGPCDKEFLVREIAWPIGHKGFYYVSEGHCMRHVHIDLMVGNASSNIQVLDLGSIDAESLSADVSNWTGLITCSYQNGAACAFAPQFDESTRVLISDFERLKMPQSDRDVDKSIADRRIVSKVRFCVNDFAKFWLATGRSDGMVSLQDVESLISDAGST